MRENPTSLLVIFLIFTLATGLPEPAKSEGFPVPESLTLIIHSDGFVQVAYKIVVDPTYPTVNITVLGLVMEDILVVDEKDLPLDFYFSNGNITVLSLGTEKVKITYFTQDLTAKTGRYWTLSVNVSTTTTVILPAEASIISLNRVPEMIESIDSQMTLSMSAGFIEVSYVIGVVGTKEHARIVLNEAENTIVQVRSLNVIVIEAETRFQEATQAFDLGNYAEAETLGYEAKDLAIQINQTATQARAQMDEAEKAMVKAEHEGRTQGLLESRNMFDQASDAYAEGKYDQALLLAQLAKTRAEESTKPFPYYEVLGAFFVALFFLMFIVYSFKNKAKNEKTEKVDHQTDIDKIFKQHDLREEEIQAIQILAENDGVVFESELFKELMLPRTSTWRMVRRLERMGIVEVKKSREQNLVCIKKRYQTIK